MSERDRHIDSFLAQHGWDGVERRRLADDASFRRYVRLMDARLGRRAVLMDAPPEKENVGPFVMLARHLKSLGFSAPAVMADDPAHGLLLLEDLGDDTYTKMLAAGVDEETLYALAVDVLIGLHRRPAAEVIPRDLPPYDYPHLLAEAMLLFDWYLPAVLGRRGTVAAQQDYVTAWLGQVLPKLSALQPTLVLRDYHVDNLMWLPDRMGVARCGLLDFQDAVVGPRAYDLMSLLEDARRDIDPMLVDAMMARYLAAFPDLDRAAFAADLAILGAQRHAKVIGIFTRLCVRDGKPDYLVHIPRVWRLLLRSVRHPVLAPLAEWLDRYLPADTRVIPPVASPAMQTRTGA
jgi:hypothetical protein